ncbi:hypothetical protein V501_01545 [Pseudogymnoascus sp. VKM F-4519 (FW-2642)]|nr:hypothetical protein V501_01545 [Pseudogymnoascus sp. VKM F-4519 (FW-2642)]
MKTLPLVWHARFFKPIVRKWVGFHAQPLQPACVFLPVISHTRPTMMECDFNLHKSNSTYFTDLDISRCELSLRLFGDKLNFSAGPHQLLMMLGGVQCSFRREIKPYMPYEVWTRILSWDDKWLYIVSHFVEKGRFTMENYRLHGKPTTFAPERTVSLECSNSPAELKQAVFATAISQFVFKNGRVTIPPAKALRGCGLLYNDGLLGSAHDDGKLEHVKWIEKRRQEWLPIAQMRQGWEAAHYLFNSTTKLSLGMYSDAMW